MWLFRRTKKQQPKLADVLEGLEGELRKLEDRINQRDRRTSRVWRMCVIYGATCEAVALTWLWANLGAEATTDRLIHAIPAILIPIVAYGSGAMHAFVSNRAKASDTAKLRDLQKEMETKVEQLRKETDFDRTQELLKRYATPQKPKPGSRIPNQSAAIAGAGAGAGAAAGTSQQGDQVPTPQTPRGAAATAAAAAAQMQLQMQTQQGQMASPRKPQLDGPVVAMAPPPQVQQDTGSWFDRVLDLVVGDTRGTSYALICSRCGYHNGFIPASEYAGAQFRCRACTAFNVKSPQQQQQQQGAPAPTPTQAPSSAAPPQQGTQRQGTGATRTPSPLSESTPPSATMPSPRKQKQ